MTSRSFRLGAAALLLLVLIPAIGPVLADTIYKKDGGRLRGQIVDETKTKVKIKAYGTVIEIDRADIARIERDGDVRSEYQKRLKKLEDWDEKGWLKLAEWCDENDLGPEAIDCWYRVIGINPNNRDARFELGHKQLKGKWVPAREYYEAKGYVRYQGLWVTKEDRDKYEQGMVKVGKEWITREAWEERRRKQEKSGKLFDDPDQPSEPEPAAKPSPKAGGKPRRRGRSPFGFGGNRFLPRAPKQDQPETPEERKAFCEQEKAKGGWQRVHMSKYYNFFSNGPEREVRAYADAMDKACVTFKKIFAYKKDIVRSFPIYMYANQQEFMSRTGRGQGVGGYYTSNGQIFSFHSKRAQSTLFHEGTHQFQGLALGRNMWSAKIWFIEGLAVYFEGGRVRAKDVDTSPIPKDRLASVKRAINSGTHVPIKTLIRMEQREFGALHYAHAWSLIYFFVNGTKGGRKRFKQYFEGVKEGRDGQKLFEECFDKPIDVIEEAWKAWVKKLRA